MQVFRAFYYYARGENRFLLLALAEFPALRRHLRVVEVHQILEEVVNLVELVLRVRLVQQRHKLLHHRVLLSILALLHKVVVLRKVTVRGSVHRCPP